MKQNKRIAITGGIGSGKSILLNIFREMGYPVVSCDEVSDGLWQDEEYRKQLGALFPACVVNGELNKAVLSALVFSDERSREKLNAFSHPYIMQKVLSAMHGKLSFAEVPLLFEGGYEGLFDGVIAVRRSLNDRILAVTRRDGATEEEVLKRINCQFDASKLEEKNCIILENDGSKEELREKAKAVLQAFLQ